jgi:hypothetical protein
VVAVVAEVVVVAAAATFAAALAAKVAALPPHQGKEQSVLGVVSRAALVGAQGATARMPLFGGRSSAARACAGAPKVAATAKRGCEGGKRWAGKAAGAAGAGAAGSER